MVELSALSYPSPDLADELVRLRRWKMDDLGCIEQASQDPRIPEGTTVPAVYSAAEGRAFVSRQWSRQTEGQGLSLAVTEPRTDMAVGLVVLMLRATPATAELGYWIVPAARGRGLATAAIRLVSRWAIQEAGLVRVEARVLPDNEPSLRALSRCGFVREGVLRSQYYAAGEHHDIVSFSLISADVSYGSTRAGENPLV